MNEQLLAVKRLMDETGVRWWVDSGTLLGLVREGDVLPWDNDIDIGIMSTDSPKVHDVLNSEDPGVMGHEYRFIKSRGRPFNHRLVPIYDDWQYAVNIGVYHKVNGLLVKPGYHFKENPSTPRSVGWWLHGLYRQPLRRIAHFIRSRTRDRGRLAHAWPLNLVYEEINFKVSQDFFTDLSSVHGFPCPSPAQEYLELRYGPGWTTPRQDWVWHEDDLAVHK